MCIDVHSRGAAKQTPTFVGVRRHCRRLCAAAERSAAAHRGRRPRLAQKSAFVLAPRAARAERVIARARRKSARRHPLALARGEVPTWARCWGAILRSARELRGGVAAAADAPAAILAPPRSTIEMLLAGVTPMSIRPTFTAFGFGR
jgi:hypothetical protein